MKNKDNKFFSQLKVVEVYFQENTGTRLMAAIETGILIQNICRYVSTLRRADRISVVKRDFCPITHFKAEFLSCNKSNFPKEEVRQLSLIL